MIRLDKIDRNKIRLADRINYLRSLGRDTLYELELTDAEKELLNDEGLTYTYDEKIDEWEIKLNEDSNE